MRYLATIMVLAGVATADIPAFKAQEIDASLKIGYGVLLADLSGDKKPDIVVADKDRVIWFENPTWTLRTITEGKTTPDNVCIDAYDIDGDGQLDLALGAGWKPGNTKDASTLQWLRRGKTLDEPWEIFPIAYDEPTLHRLRWADLDGSGLKVLVTVPLMGRGSTKEKNWSESGVRIQVRYVPQDPTKADWRTTTINQTLHVAHNFQVVHAGDVVDTEILVASFEGVTVLKREAPWVATTMADGDQSNPGANRGASEVKLGKLKNGGRFIATIEPWHGNKVIVYTQPTGAEDWKREVIDERLRWGHAIWCADLDGDGGDEVMAGVRDPLPGQAESGVRVYQTTQDAAIKWRQSDLDPGGVAVEDLAVADLNGDGKPDIVAVGRQTKNVKVYWNQAK